MAEWESNIRPDQYRQIIHNSRRLMSIRKKKTANWIIAMEIFGCGSTYAWEICRYSEIDGDAFTVGEIWRRG